tara:strand:- start:30 stop:299 length:270 start_codon:yes stop_codon:yes gene_type:complete
MSTKIIKPQLSTETNLTTTYNTISGCRLVRLWNNNTNTDRLITLADTDDTSIGTITIPFKTEMFIQKETTDQLKVNTGTDVLATSIAFT